RHTVVAEALEVERLEVALGRWRAGWPTREDLAEHRRSRAARPRQFPHAPFEPRHRAQTPAQCRLHGALDHVWSHNGAEVAQRSRWVCDPEHALPRDLERCEVCASERMA